MSSSRARNADADSSAPRAQHRFVHAFQRFHFAQGEPAQLERLLADDFLPDLNRLAPHAPVLMISAHASVPGAVEGRIEGVSATISKPFELSDVLGLAVDHAGRCM